MNVNRRKRAMRQHATPPVIHQPERVDLALLRAPEALNHESRAVARNSSSFKDCAVADRSQRALPPTIRIGIQRHK